MSVADLLITVGVLVGLFVIVYSKMKGLTLSDTISEVRDIVNPLEIYNG